MRMKSVVSSAVLRRASALYRSPSVCRTSMSTPYMCLSYVAAEKRRVVSGGEDLLVSTSGIHISDSSSSSLYISDQVPLTNEEIVTLVKQGRLQVSPWMCMLMYGHMLMYVCILIQFNFHSSL
jgi:hypothetical protein